MPDLGPLLLLQHSLLLSIIQLMIEKNLLLPQIFLNLFVLQLEVGLHSDLSL